MLPYSFYFYFLHAGKAEVQHPPSIAGSSSKTSHHQQRLIQMLAGDAAQVADTVLGRYGGGINLAEDIQVWLLDVPVLL